MSQQVAAALTVDIVSGSIRPGTRLDENSIAKRFKVSRTPVRDALRWLAASGLVEFAPRRGCSVMPVERAKVQDAYEAFGEIEALCARLCALRAGLTEREVLIEIACRLFDMGRLHLWPAAQLAGLTRVEMEGELMKRKIPIYRPTVEDVEEDVETMKRLGI